MVGYKGNLNSIVVVPDPILRKKSKNVKNSELKKIRDLLKSMTYLLDKYSGIGLSAVQVGILKNFFIIKKDFEKEKIDFNNYLDEIEVYINPEIIEYSTEKQDGWEGCLSIPNVECLVERHKKIKVKYIDIDGNIVVKEIEDLRAIVFQHEYDHTQGILILDKAKQIREVGD
ncbi:MAG: peptide deformylase [Candidatus Calescibacterium sp.]|nr:peptide deformylase [Candidatus Calescibacterium sp.]MDW8132518.1 peptide deformylase [Candidatus Calescibacterium sp.]